MSGDYSRKRFKLRSCTRRCCGRGRVDLDADWNEYVDPGIVAGARDDRCGGTLRRAG